MAAIHNPNKPTQSFRRRAVYTALSEFLDDQERMVIMCLWQKRYSEQPAYALNKFVSDVCALLKGACSRAAINRKIVWALGLQPEQLDEDPINRIEEHCKQHKHNLETNEELLPQEIVFQRLFFQFTRELNSTEYGTEESVKKHIIEHLSILELNSASRLVESWLRSGNTFVSRMLNLQQMRSIIHLVYICGCEYCGPSSTDRALTIAVKTASIMPEAKLFPAEKFI